MLPVRVEPQETVEIIVSPEEIEKDIFIHGGVVIAEAVCGRTFRSVNSEHLKELSGRLGSRMTKGHPV